MPSKKNTFVLRINYRDILNDLPDPQAGQLIKAVFAYAQERTEPDFAENLALKMAFKFIKQDLDYDTTKYEELCQKRAEFARKAKKGTQTADADKNAPKAEKRENEKTDASISKHKQAYASISTHKQAYASISTHKQAYASISMHNDNDIDNDNDVVVVVDSDSDVVDDSDNNTSDINNIKSIAKNAMPATPKDPDEGTFRAEPKTKAQELGCWYVFRYFSELFAEAGKAATTQWFKRNGRALNAVLRLADNDVNLARALIVETEHKMTDFGKRKGEEIVWGLEAVEKGFSENYVAAKRRVERGDYA